MKKILVLILVFVLLLLSACANNTNIENQIISPDDEVIGEWIVNKNENQLVLAVYSVDTFQPIITKSTSVSDAMSLIYDSLFDVDANLKQVGNLASGYSVSSDGMTVTVNLKTGVKWHDGSDFTAKDVDYTVKSIMQSESVYKSYLQNVVSYSTSGANQYIFKLNKPVPNFTAMLTFPIIKNGTVMEAGIEYIPVGTGPYKYDGQIGSKRISLTQNSSWHGGNVGMENIVLSVLKDKETAVAAFEANEVSCITSKTINLNQYTPKGKIRTSDYVSNNMVYVGINFYKQVLWGVGTRQALSYIINKDEIIEKQIYNRAVAVDVPVNPSAWYYDMSDRIYYHDKDIANDLLIKDGWNKIDVGYSRIIDGVDTRLSLDILVNGENEEKVNIANAVAKNLADCEIVANVKAVPYTEYMELINNKQFDLFIGEIVMPANMDSTYLVGSGGNYFTYSSSEMDLLINDIGRANTDDGVKKSYTTFCKLFNTDIPFIPLFFRKESLIFDESIAGSIEPCAVDVYSGITEWYIEQK